MATNISAVSITVTNPETRDLETHRFDDLDAAIAWLTKRKNTKKIEVKSED